MYPQVSNLLEVRTISLFVFYNKKCFKVAIILYVKQNSCTLKFNKKIVPVAIDVFIVFLCKLKLMSRCIKEGLNDENNFY